jgi:hypothetical protein
MSPRAPTFALCASALAKLATDGAWLCHARAPQPRIYRLPLRRGRLALRPDSAA